MCIRSPAGELLLDTKNPLCWITSIDISSTGCVRMLVFLRPWVRASRSKAHSAVDRSHFVAITSGRVQGFELKLLVRNYECKTSLCWAQNDAKKLPGFDVFKLNRMFVEIKLTQLLKPSKVCNPIRIYDQPVVNITANEDKITMR